MKHFSGIPSRPALVVVLLGIRLVGGMTAAAPNPNNTPATVGQKANEAEFSGVTLPPKAEERLGIRTAKVERKKLSQVRKTSRACPARTRA